LPRWEIAMARPFGIAWSAGRFSAFGQQVPSKWAGPMPRYYGSIHRELATEIRNEAGEPLLRATLVFEVERLRWLLSAGSAARRHR
jgi:hypothetical protein